MLGGGVMNLFTGKNQSMERGGVVTSKKQAHKENSYEHCLTQQ